MMPEIRSGEITDINEQQAEVEKYKEIRPRDEADSVEKCDAFWNDVFSETAEKDSPEDNLDEIIAKYFDDLRKYSEFLETIPEKPFEKSDLHQRMPEENMRMREEFDDVKSNLKRQWVEANGRPWPKYEKDVYSSNGKLIRKVGSDYDAHHIQPLGMGGKNDADNITPLSAENHYDRQGVHAPNSPYSIMDKMLGGNSND